MIKPYLRHEKEFVGAKESLKLALKFFLFSNKRKKMNILKFSKSNKGSSAVKDAQRCILISLTRENSWFPGDSNRMSK